MHVSFYYYLNGNEGFAGPMPTNILYCSHFTKGNTTCINCTEFIIGLKYSEYRVCTVNIQVVCYVT